MKFFIFVVLIWGILRVFCISGIFWLIFSVNLLFVRKCMVVVKDVVIIGCFVLWFVVVVIICIVLEIVFVVLLSVVVFFLLNFLDMNMVFNFKFFVILILLMRLCGVFGVLVNV